MTITPRQTELLLKLDSHQKVSPRKERLVTRILELKLEGLTHAEIAKELNYSKVYIDTLHAAARKALTTL